MQVKLNNGQLFINGQKVLAVVFDAGKSMSFPVDENEEISIDGGNVSASANGENNTVVSQKNVITGSTINATGGFRLGDG